MAGKLCPNCKQRTLFVSGDNERICTKCGYTQKIDPFEPLKLFFGGVMITIILSAVPALLEIKPIILIPLWLLYPIISLCLLIRGKRNGQDVSAKQFICSVIYFFIALITITIIAIES